MSENIHKVRYRRDVEYCIRVKNMGGSPFCRRTDGHQDHRPQAP